MSGPWHQKQPVPCSFSRNIFCFQITIFKTSHKKLDGTSWATVKDTGESSPRATSPWESQHPKSAPPQMPTQPLTSRDPQLPEQATHWQCHQPDDIHLRVCRARLGCFLRGGRAAGPAPLLCPVGKVRGPSWRHREWTRSPGNLAHV